MDDTLLITNDDGCPHQDNCCSDPDTSQPEHDCDDSCFELHHIYECRNCGASCSCEV